MTVNDFKQNNTPLIIPMNDQSYEIYKDLIKPLGHEPMLIFDIDSTLYSTERKFEIFLKEKLAEHFSKELKLSHKDALELTRKLNEKYGLTITGYKNEFNKPVNFLLEIIEKVNFEDFLKEDKKLKNILDNLNVRKICFTNAIDSCAIKVLKCLGISECFEAVIHVDIFQEKIVNKPHNSSYDFIEKLFQIHEPSEKIISESVSSLRDTSSKNVLFFDDAEKNIKAAIENRWQAIHILNDSYIGDVITRSVNEKLFLTESENEEV